MSGKTERIEYFQNNAKQFEEIFHCELVAFDPSYRFYFPESLNTLTLPYWFISEFNERLENLK